MKEKFKSWAFSKEHGKCDVITLIIYLLGVCTITYFHEPWFDEAQAWAIAKSGTLKEILFEIPHYEGHPPLWDLLLLPFAKLGAPYELSLAIVNIFFITLAVAVLLFKSPFPKIVRCLLPFNFFLFYQFGVISRPYCILVLAMFLAAACHKNRNEHPVKYLLCLALMCSVHTFGIIIAGGFCIVWLGEIFGQHYKNGTLAKVLTDKRCWLMLALLLFVVLILIEIFPSENTYVDGKATSKKIFHFSFNFIQLLWIFLILTEAAVGQMPQSLSTSYDTTSLITLSIVAVIIFILAVSIFYSNKKLLNFLVPYLIFSLFCTLVYFSPHHMGIITALLIYEFWIIVDESGKVKLPKYIQMLMNNLHGKMRTVAKSLAFIPLLVPIAWSCSSSYFEIRYPYWINAAADFIKEYDLDDYKILSPWTQEPKENVDVEWALDDSTLDYYDYPKLQGWATAILPYFDNNIFYNYNIDDHDKTFMYYQSSTEEEAEAIINKWREQGPPDVVLDRCQLTRVYPDIDVNDYVAVKRITAYKPYKFTTSEQYITIYVTKDLFNKIGTLKEITAKKLY
ncbi:hypothetical protein [Ruminococcus sp.]|uniref:hypothetical protein n=1 Tax=Ruminococcus sp. TaxID=41978 RepID=UPI0025D3208D|nr:hypothetical protein [uncultured Ruminococcus sp.]